MESMGERIKRLRLEKGMTLQEVGDAVGVGKSTVRKWETGMIANMKRDKIAKLAEALGTTPAELLGWNNAEMMEQVNQALESLKNLPPYFVKTFSKDKFEVLERVNGYPEGMIKRLLAYLEFFEKNEGGDPK